MKKIGSTGYLVAILTPAAPVSFLVGSYLAGIVGVEKVLIGAGGLALVGLADLQMRQARPVQAPPVTADWYREMSDNGE